MRSESSQKNINKGGQQNVIFPYLAEIPGMILSVNDYKCGHNLKLFMKNDVKEALICWIEIAIQLNEQSLFCSIKKENKL